MSIRVTLEFSKNTNINKSEENLENGQINANQVSNEAKISEFKWRMKEMYNTPLHGITYLHSFFRF